MTPACGGHAGCMRVVLMGLNVRLHGLVGEVGKAFIVGHATGKPKIVVICGIGERRGGGRGEQKSVDEELHVEIETGSNV